MPNKILVITPTNHIKNFKKNFGKKFKVKYCENIKINEFIKISSKYDAIFTNPNKLEFYLGSKTIRNIGRLKVICTASTGTDHIDIEYFKKKGIKILSLTKDLKLLNKLSATSELAFAFTLLSIRDVLNSNSAVKNGFWDYTKFIGNQLSNMNIGIIGYGRLGKMFANYCNAFNAKVYIYDPYKKIPDKYIKVNKIENVFKTCDVVSLHLHLNEKSRNLINYKLFNLSKNNLKLINTSRGGIVKEKDLINFLKKNKSAKYFSDVINNEYQNNKKKNKLIKFMKSTKQIIITPHIGGMTIESQTLAFNFAAKKLTKFFRDNK